MKRIITASVLLTALSFSSCTDRAANPPGTPVNNRADEAPASVTSSETPVDGNTINDADDTPGDLRAGGNSTGTHTETRVNPTASDRDSGL